MFKDLKSGNGYILKTWVFLGDEKYVVTLQVSLVCLNSDFLEARLALQ